MDARRDGDADRIDAVDEAGQIVDRVGAELRGHMRGPRTIDVVDAHKEARFYLGVHAGMEPPEVSHADHPDLDHPSSLLA